MEQNTTRRNLWESAGKAGLALGAVSTAYLFLTQFLGVAGLSTTLSMILSMLLWAVKFAACIWLMMTFMKRFAKENPDADNSKTHRFGMATALLSALIYAAASFANVAFISADMLAEQMDLMMQQMAPLMDSNTMNQMDEVMAIMPQLTFFSNLVYCFLFGALLSFILSRNIPSTNPFADRTSDEW